MHHQDQIKQIILDKFEAIRPSGDEWALLKLATGYLKMIPTFVPLWLEQGRSLQRLGMQEHALVSYGQALALRPDLLTGRFMMSQCVLEGSGGVIDQEYVRSLDVWNTHIDPLFITTMFQVGIDLATAQSFDEALACLMALDVIMVRKDMLYHNIASTLFFMERFEEANPYFIQWIVPSAQKFGFTVWYGEDLTDKVLYVHADNGLGDIIRGVRFLPALARRCAKMIVRLEPSLRRLVGDIANVEWVTETPPTCDYYTTTYVLPHVLGIDRDAFLKPIPYLRAEDQAIAHWRERLPQKGFRIGIAWKSGALPGLGRVIPLAAFAPLAQMPGVVLISLQMGKGVEELEHLPQGMEVVNLGPDFNAGPDNFIDTAAVMKSVDLILSIDTSVIHLGGALDCPVWMLLDYAASYHWLLNRDDTLWYKSVRLFRQEQDGAWGAVIERVCNEVMRLVGA